MDKYDVNDQDAFVKLLNDLENKEEKVPSYFVFEDDDGLLQKIEVNYFTNDSSNELEENVEEDNILYERAYFKSSQGMSVSTKNKLKNLGKVAAATILIATTLYGCSSYVEMMNEREDIYVKAVGEFDEFAARTGIPANADNYVIWIQSHMDNSNVNKR